MISFDKITALSDNPKILAFAEFVISEAGDRPYPDYRQIDLMKVAGLVSHVFVLDYRAGFEGGILIHFSGTEIDDLFGHNITGQRSDTFYSGDDIGVFIMKLYRQAYVTGQPAYTRRSVHFKDATIDKNRIVENIMFPCSSDGDTIDFGLGFAQFTLTNAQIENRYILIDPLA
ncbi:MAG: hypothetical protein HQ483_14875 [Rhodospirillales bacterium]|nr:hypothetical protein [Rhodospirillales bacterium]